VVPPWVTGAHKPPLDRRAVTIEHNASRIAVIFVGTGARTAMRSSEIEICVLGPVGVSRAGHEVALGGSKPRTVLAALLLARGWAVPDGHLNEMLWGWNPPATMSAQIYTYVSRLRKRLAPEIDIARQGAGYLLRLGSAELDFDQFERLTRLGEEHLARGEFEKASGFFQAGLQEWSGPALANVTEFLTRAENPRLNEARMTALEARIDADLAVGRHRQLVSELTGLTGRYPLRERLRVQLMTALYSDERQGDALRVYYEARRTLSEELGVDPGPALTAAYHAILHAQLSFRPETVVRAAAQRRPALQSIAVAH
jgi:DNA-binding SARP family transcriptional activator